MTESNINIVITTFHSQGVIHTCLESISPKIKIIVIENSSNEKFKQEIELKYSNVKCILTGSNIGYSKANNLGLSNVKTKYALVLNPDTVLQSDSIENFLKIAEENKHFWLFGPVTDQGNIAKQKTNKIVEVENLKGFAIFFNMSKFNNRFFDENFFLYFEEIDLCKRVKDENGYIFLDPKIKIKHMGASSVNNEFKIELEKNRNWHWMWSTFYFHKKYKGFIIAFLIIFPKLLKSFIKIIFYSFTLNTKRRNIYFYRLSGIINSILGKRSWHRPTLD